MTEEIPCPCEPCDFVLDELDENTFEQMEQHIRWIHLPKMDFGENPMPALTNLMMNGILRPEEFATCIRTILNRELDKHEVHPGPAMTALEAVIGALLLAGIVCFEVILDRRDLGWLGFVVAVALGAGMASWSIALLRRWR